MTYILNFLNIVIFYSKALDYQRFAYFHEQHTRLACPVVDPLVAYCVEV
jgi:hypothetical protein